MKPWLLRLVSILFPLMWGNKYSQVDKCPSKFEFTVIKWLLKVKSTFHPGNSNKIEVGGKDHKSSELWILRKFTAYTAPVSASQHTYTEPLSTVSLCWVAHPKDFPILFHSIRSAFLHLQNPVGSVKIITPDSQSVNSLLEWGLGQGYSLTVVEDAEYLPECFRRNLVEAFPTHGSWAAQQLIKVAAALENRNSPTLVIDSDTVLLRNIAWMPQRSVQLLHARSFINHRYREFLSDWGIDCQDPLRSFVTHHMLFQPDLLEKAVMTAFGTCEQGEIISRIVESSKKLGFPEFSLDYELYGQVVAAQFPQRIQFEKYSNLGLNRVVDSHGQALAIEKLRKAAKFSSVSFHKPDR